MHIQRMANRRERGIDRAHIGTDIDNPAVSFSKLAASMGMWSTGPIDKPGELATALRRAPTVIKRSDPALVEVLTQARQDGYDPNPLNRSSARRAAKLRNADGSAGSGGG